MTRRDLILVNIVCIVWGFNFLAGAKAMQVFPPMFFMVMRFALVLTVTLPFLRWPPAGQWVRLSTGCVAMGAMHFTFMFWALQLSSDVTSIVLTQNTYIPMAVLMAALFLNEKVGWRTILAIAMSFIGVLVIGFDPLVLQQLDAMTLILISAFFQAVAAVLMRGVSGIGPMNFQAWTAIFSLPILIMMTLVFEQNQMGSVSLAGPMNWAALVYTAIIASLVGHGLFYILVQRNPVPSLMPYMLLMPVYSALFGIFLWGDRPGPRLLIGGSMVLLGILFITLRRKSRITSPDLDTLSQ